MRAASLLPRKLLRSYLPRPVVGMLRGRRQGVKFLLEGAQDRRVGLLARGSILARFQQISDSVVCAQAEPETLLLARGVLSLNSSLQGDIAECGCFKGGSTAKLSIVAKAARRKLYVFDSFAGLPAVGGERVAHYYNVLDGVAVNFDQGSYQAALEEVKANVDRFGEGEAVQYIPGFFADSMPGWQQPLAMIVLDVDLVESTKTCIRYLWPQLSAGGLLFSQDAHLQEIVTLLRDAQFWHSVGESRPPHFVGLGTSKMVYARKTRGR